MKKLVICTMSLPLFIHAQGNSTRGGCKALPSHERVVAALQAIVAAGGNGGLGNHMWATLVNRDGEVCVVAFSGANRGSQWPGSRVISAQKANTANAFSLDGFALSTANLYSAVQPGGSLFGLQHSNPVDTDAAYGGNSEHNGAHNDHMTGRKIGGVNVFGGGLGLYTPGGELVGGIGLSGDTSCTDHIIAWKLRFRLNLDNVPAGVAGAGKDNIIHDLGGPSGGHATSPGPSGWGHPACDAAATAAAANLPVGFPAGPNPAP